MYYIGIDIGSTAAKVAVFENENLIETFTLPTGWSSVETAQKIKEILEEKGIKVEESKVVATGYGRVAVPYAHKVVTEITCHGVGAKYIFDNDDMVVIDVGGQDTKVIELTHGLVNNFYMNDKCSAGTGRFLEVMANTLGLTLGELSEYGRKGADVTISSMCTVFAESEVISLIGAGTKKEDIAFGVINSVVNKVASMCSKMGENSSYYLTGGLCENSYFLEELSKKLKSKVKTDSRGRYAGAIGAGILSKRVKK
ncbi:acyl-CoA dehydratase activase [Cetobacterium ceti]